MRSSNSELGIGTGGGTLLSMLAFINAQDVLTTVVMAALGAAVSFIVTRLLQRWYRQR